MLGLLNPGIVAASAGGSSDPLAAHVATLRTIDSGGKYILADPAHYAAGIGDAGVFADAFGSAFQYVAPNAMASPTPVQDSTSSQWYASLDGADDRAIGSGTETVGTWIAVLRSPPAQTTWSSYGSPLSVYSVVHGPYNTDAGYFGAGTTSFQDDGVPRPRSIRKNGTLLATAFTSLAPITDWMVLTSFAGYPTTVRTMQIGCLEDTYFARLHLAALRIWPSDPTSDAIADTEAELTRFFGPLLATTP